ncbi:PAS domain-containing protein [Paraburkholderia guartelaensis]|uniref:PAS domain-containing protein n=1 Tax=Paraburkholderia guartelaensis TaxID=2546446 RepID=UPI002AB62C6C|nr:PAS domain-containing protein [Paraburkholderia guartelaensis]
MNTTPIIRILLVEDNPTDLLLIEEALTEVPDFESRLVRAGRLSDALVLTRREPVDVVLLDLGLPDAQGLDAFTAFRQQAPELPVLVLTGLEDMSVGLQAIQDGAQDYLPKRDIRASELSRAIRYAIERHRAAAALKESEERFQLAVSGASAGLWDWNPGTGSVYVSSHTGEMLGYEEGELSAQDAVFEMTHPEDVELVKARLAAHLKGRHPYDVEYRVRTKSGEYRWIQSRAQALWNRSGEPYRMVGWIIDVTERRRAEEALRRSREELQRLSANIEHAREVEKTRIARELHDDLGQQLAALKIEVSRVEGRLNDIATTAVGVDVRNLYAMIDMLVDSVRRIATDLRPIMLDDLGLIPAIDWFLDRYSVRHGVRVVRHIDADEIDFNAESATAVFRIVQEALTNVARHSGATEVTVEIVCVGPDCIVRIADNGRGRPADAREAVNSFGLLGMRERAANLQGTLQIRTAPEEGFTLTVTLPLASVQARE